jgi:hypothetical protein
MPEHVDYVAGHTRFSGPDAHATRDTKYPDAKLIHFVHMVPEALGRVKEDTEAGEAAKGVENHAIERDLVAGADLAVRRLGSVLFGTDRAQHRRAGLRGPGADRSSRTGRSAGHRR